MRATALRQSRRTNSSTKVLLVLMSFLENSYYDHRLHRHGLILDDWDIDCDDDD